MLTVSQDTEHLLGALRAGAVGYLPKDMPPDRLPAALRGVLAGETALPRALVGPVLGKLRELPGGSGEARHMAGLGLTEREDEIMRLLRSGLGTADIGRTLSLSPVTVRRHISTAVAKLGVANRSEAIRVLTPSA
jgi:DNA-binding NarL/FixJ family response regulator